ncbi:MAG: hypothetical protein QNJ29_00735 [Rhizobiaceae bacterium]|nr:hypothetical protein [Rhizobiaceae bacterium]
MKSLLKIGAVLATALVTACTTASNEDVLTSAIGTTDSQTVGTPQQNSIYQQAGAPEPLIYSGVRPETQPTLGPSIARQPVPENASSNVPRIRSAFTSENRAFGQPAIGPRANKTYLINGLASNIGNIGIGFTKLSRKIPGSVLHNYASFVESSTVIRSRVTKELKAAYRRNPNVEINLIGISFGANIVTIIANDLNRSKIPVNYLATLDGPAMLPIPKNVRITDNFTCTNIDCFRTNTRLGWGNKKTVKESFRLKTSHIPLASHPQVHTRILQQIQSPPPFTNTTFQ